MKKITMREVKNEMIKTLTKAAMLLSAMACFLMPGNEASWLPVINAVLMGWMYLVMKANIKSF